jgi:predicted O-methyltransferase YrrM
MSLLRLAEAGRVPWQRHWTPRYLVHRTRQLYYERTHPDDPWLTPDAIRLLTALLRPCDRGLEFGSGRSTLWFAERVAHLTSVEEDERYHRAAATALARRGLDNVDLVLAPCDVPEHLGAQSAYVGTLRRFPESSLDFALIDGAYRAHAARLAMPRIRPGGLMIIDNVDWYLPSRSRSRGPAARPAAAGPDPLWRDLAGDLDQWRTIWTGSGVWDTAIFVRP